MNATQQKDPVGYLTFNVHDCTQCLPALVRVLSISKATNEPVILNVLLILHCKSLTIEVMPGDTYESARARLAEASFKLDAQITKEEKYHDKLVRYWEGSDR